jgi:hypothetical protein
MRQYLNDGSADEPKLRVYLNLDNLADLRPDTLWPELEGDERMARLRADGFDGVQVTGGQTLKMFFVDAHFGREFLLSQAGRLKPAATEGFKWLDIQSMVKGTGCG